ncbi:MAG TPA: sulfotransferase [Caulobacteraceae bacterium]|jgi:tetratricopeptide (TPR) repeat protein
MKRPFETFPNVDVRLHEAASLAKAGRLKDAAAAYERAARANPVDFRAPYSLAVIELSQGRPDRAIVWLIQVVAIKPDFFEGQHNLGVAAQALEIWSQSAGAYARALELRPGAVETRQNLAIVLAIDGRIDEALAEHHQIAADPAHKAWALTRIALLQPSEIDDAELSWMREAAAGPATDGDTRIGLQFALGEVLERRGDDAAAFDAFALGNRLKHAALAASDPAERPDWLVAAHAASARTVASSFSAASLSRGGRGLSTEAPIFVVGMPRSGSTLLEQVLSAHPDVVALGETAALPQLLEGQALVEASQKDVRTVARTYLEAMRKRGWRGVGRFVDKTLENYLHVGAIALLFPNAVILHAVRDPVDTCLSCYRQLFASGAETLYDLADIGAEYVTYRRLMEHWAEVLPGRVVDVDHEALVAAPDGQIRWLVTEACGLPWNDACLEFHHATGPVRTASARQVRQPIFRTSIDRWRRHEARLGPLLEALGPYAPQGGG